MSPRRFILLAFGISSPAFAADDFVPTPQDISRYEHIWKSSPFVSASEPVQQSESLTNRMVLTGFAKIDGSDVAFLFDRTDLRRFTITKGNPVKGVELVSVDNRGRLKDSSVRIKIGSDVGDIKYDANSAAGTGGGEGIPSPTVSAASLPTIPNQQPNQSGQPVMPNSNVSPSDSPTAGIENPQRPRIVPKRFVRRLATPQQ